MQQHAIIHNNKALWPPEVANKTTSMGPVAAIVMIWKAREAQELGFRPFLATSAPWFDNLPCQHVLGHFGLQIQFICSLKIAHFFIISALLHM